MTDEYNIADAIDARLETLVRHSADGLVRFGVSTDAVTNNAGHRKDTITEEDIEALIVAISQRYHHLPEEQLAAIKTELLRRVGASKTTYDGLAAHAMSQAQLASHDLANKQQPLTLPEQLRDMMEAYKESSFAARKELAEDGYSDSDENEKKLNALWNRLEKLEPGTDEWNKVRNEIYAMDNDYFSRVEKEAEARGDDKAAEKAQRFKEKAREQQREVDDLYRSVDNENRLAASENKVAEADSHLRLAEDNSAIVLQAAKPLTIPVMQIDMDACGNLPKQQTPVNKFPSHTRST